MAVALALGTSLLLPAPAMAVGNAWRYWSNGSGEQSQTFVLWSQAYPWIQEYAKGRYVSLLGHVYYVVLRDQATDPDITDYWRGPGYLYYNRSDPYNKTRDIQYTLSNMGYSVTVDNWYGSGTTAAVRAFQQDHGLTQDGIIGLNGYVTLSSAS